MNSTLRELQGGVPVHRTDSDCTWSLRFVLTLVALSVFGASAAFALWFALLRRASLGQLNVLMFLTPIFGLVMGVVFFAERLHTLELTGIGLSLLGIYGVSRPAKARACATAPGE